MKDVYLIILVATATLFSLITADDNLESGVRDEKLISTFQIVRFPNDACIASSATRNGTCYTSAECSDLGGTSSGSCADGFGVCCIFVITSCGMTASQNITYWDAPTTIPDGDCNLAITAVNDNICQLRLDFLTFVITGPNTLITAEILLFGSGIPGGAIPGTGAAGMTVGGVVVNNQASWTTNCLVDSFSVSSPNPANKPPSICGINSGFHMYVDMDSDYTNVLSFVFQTVNGPTAAIAQNTRGIAALATRDWDMTILQYECGYVNQAPPGCTQYFWSDTGAQVGGWIQTYNFQATGTKHLANQNQKVCIRREQAVCWAAFYLNAAGTFEISGRTALGALVPNSFAHPGEACGYGGALGTGQTDADTQLSYDCIIMPGLFAVAASTVGTITVAATAANVQTSPRTAATNHSPAPPQLGGGGIFGGDTLVAGLFAALGETGNAATLFTQHVPFMMTFKSDGFEGTGTDMESAILTNSIGLKMSYDLIPCS